MNRLLSSVRPKLWRIPRRSRLANTSAEKFEGPEPPNGFLFNEKVRFVIVPINAHQTPYLVTVSIMQPLLPGEKRQKELWENVWVYGMMLNLLLVIGIVAFKPDTS